MVSLCFLWLCFYGCLALLLWLLGEKPQTALAAAGVIWCSCYCLSTVGSCLQVFFGEEVTWCKCWLVLLVLLGVHS